MQENMRSRFDDMPIHRHCILPRTISRRRLFGAMGVSRFVIAMMISGQMLSASAAMAATPIGEVERLKSTSYGTPPDEPRITKQLKDPVVFNELLETLSFSALEASLLNGSVLTLGASAKVVLDEFVYDPANASAGAILDMVEGSLRFVSGDIPKEAFRVTTPLCTIGIRGTNFKVRVRPNGDSLIAVDEGSVLVTVNSSGQQITVDEGQSVEIRRTGNAAAPVDEVDFTDDEVLLVGNEIVDFGWGDEMTDEANDQTDEAGNIYIVKPTKPKSRESDSGGRSGGGGGEGGN